jgi:hypothetical protein
MIRMSSSLVVLEDRILFFYGQTSAGHGAQMWADIGMATLRLDGFVALVASGERTGRLLTKPFLLAGDRLYINAAAENSGSITVVLRDEAGAPVPGFKSRLIREDGIKLPVTWRANANLSEWRGRSVRLKFVMQQARLYSFGFEDTQE